MTLNLSSLFANEWQFMQNTEPVTLFRKTGDGSFDAGTQIANALRLAAQQEQIAGGAGAKTVVKLPWLMWSNQAGAMPPKTGDYVQDASGAKWSIVHADTQAWGARYFVETIKDR